MLFGSDLTDSRRRPVRQNSSNSERATPSNSVSMSLRAPASSLFKVIRATLRHRLTWLEGINLWRLRRREKDSDKGRGADLSSAARKRSANLPSRHSRTSQAPAIRSITSHHLLQTWRKRRLVNTTIERPVCSNGDRYPIRVGIASASMFSKSSVGNAWIGRRAFWRCAIMRDRRPIVLMTVPKVVARVLRVSSLRSSRIRVHDFLRNNALQISKAIDTIDPTVQRLTRQPRV